MSKAVSRVRRNAEKDTMRPEYDFSDAVRGVTAPWFPEGTNVVVIDPEVMDVFPNSASVNEALRALAPVLRHQRAARTRKQTTTPRSRNTKQSA
jgi:hypothetical protein